MHWPWMRKTTHDAEMEAMREQHDDVTNELRAQVVTAERRRRDAVRIADDANRRYKQVGTFYEQLSSVLLRRNSVGAGGGPEPTPAQVEVKLLLDPELVLADQSKVADHVARELGAKLKDPALVEYSRTRDFGHSETRAR